MRFLKYIFCALLFATASVAETININWINDGKTYAQTTCDVGGDVILPTTPTKRGYTFVGWLTGYTRLEYIESTGTQYIDTGVPFSRNNEFYFEFEKVTQLGGENKGYGAGVTLNANITGGGREGSGVLQPYCFGGNLPYSPAVLSSDWYGKKYIETFTTYNNQISFVLTDNNGVQYRTTNRTMPHDWQTTGNNVYLFRDDSSDFDYPSCIKIYRVWLKKDGVLVRDFIPAKRNSDSVIGMYDTVSGQFFTNAGTGEFIAGPVAKNQSFDE